MWLFTRQEAKTADRLTQESGVGEELLMERAGQASAAAIAKSFQKKFHIAHPKAVVLCGTGHNGGDGKVVARCLKEMNWQVQVLESGAAFDPALKADVWVDALFGIGLNRHLNKEHQDILHWVNSKPGFKVALDVPSGLDCDTGNIFGACFKADLTLTVERPKVGFYFNQGPLHCGWIRIVPIGFTKDTIRKSAKRVFLLNPALAARWIPVRSPTDHKSKGGKALIWAGSKSMPGAAILASQAAARIGAGYVYISEKQVLNSMPEAILFDKKNLDQMTSILIGPGLGLGKNTSEAIRTLRNLSQPVVIDADALTEAAKFREDFLPFPENWVATPHMGELSRLLGLPTEDLDRDRLQTAELAREALGCTVLLKGFHTVVALKDFSVVIPTGNVALAKGGSGDVLAGLIVGLLSQNVSPERAAMLGAYVHGEIADRWLRTGKDVLSLTPSDLLEELPRSLAALRLKVKARN